MNAVEKEVYKLVDKELLSANNKFPLFQSKHEGWAVLLEELEGCKDELELIEAHMNGMWTLIKRNGSCENADMIKKHAINLAIEAIQVAAMCDKYVLSLKKTEIIQDGEICGTICPCESCFEHESYCKLAKAYKRLGGD